MSYECIKYIYIYIIFNICIFICAGQDTRHSSSSGGTNIATNVMKSGSYFALARCYSAIAVLRIAAHIKKKNQMR